MAETTARAAAVGVLCGVRGGGEVLVVRALDDGPGLRVTRLGTSSVRYEVALFGGDAPLAAAQGHFVHVYVDRESRRPAALPPPLRAALHDLAA